MRTRETNPFSVNALVLVLVGMLKPRFKGSNRGEAAADSETNVRFNSKLLEACICTNEWGLCV